MNSEAFNALDTLISQMCIERQLWDLRKEWSRTKERLQQKEALEQEVARLQELLKGLDQNAQSLIEPPFQYAIYLGRSPGEEKDAVVGLGTARLEVRMKDELVEQLTNLMPGQRVLLNDKQNVVALRDEYITGETAEVVNIILSQNEATVVRIVEGSRPLQLVAHWREEDEITVTCSPELERQGVQPQDKVEIHFEAGLALPREKPRLHVKTHGNEGTIVEISDRLYKQSVRIGDIVRIEPGLKFAFEKLPAYETGELTIEEVPDVTYEDIGGLDNEIDAIHDAIELPYLHREAFERYQLGRPKGILLYGPPGCGKTMVAKAVANSLTSSIRQHLQRIAQHILLYQQFERSPADPQLREAVKAILPPLEMDNTSQSLVQRFAEYLGLYDVEITNLDAHLDKIRTTLNKRDGVRGFFLNVKGPELLDKYVGETEHRIRKIFEIARTYATYYTPVVIFFDEMEAMFRTRGSGRSSDIETTIVPQFLAELDGVESSSDLIIIGASNRQDMIDPAILRPKRLDVKINVGRPNKHSAEEIFARYLLPTLPLGSQDITLPTELLQPGACVFRTAYPEFYPRNRPLAQDSDPQGTGDFHGLLPPGCDFRLALSINLAELDALAALPPHTTIQKALQGEEQEEHLPWDKLQRFRSSLEIAQLVNCLRTLRTRMDREEIVRQKVHAAIRQEWLAEAMIKHAIDLLYGHSSVIYALGSRGTPYVLPLKDFMSGAIIANIIDRAKKLAIKRMLLRTEVSQEGICLQDIDYAIEHEFLENKDQLTIHRLQIELAHRDEEILSTQLFLHTQEKDPWSEEKLPLYKNDLAVIAPR